MELNVKLINDINSFRLFDDNIEPEENTTIGVKLGTNTDNIVCEETLRKVQKETLRKAKQYLSKTFGPMGSNTKIISGNNRATISSVYSKDGLKVLKSIANSGPIEASIIEELIDITRHVEKEVGDGTTSTVILSSLVFEKLLTIKDKYNIPPFKLISLFKSTVQQIKDKIQNSKKECTVDDIYDISMISTNGNTEVSNNIKTIYETYGMDVNLSVGISNTADNIVKVYDGLTISEGYMDPVFVTNKSLNTAEINDAHIYRFVDPIDNMMLIQLFESILKANIYNPLENEEAPIPTVIVCPKLTRDMSATLKTLSNQLYQFDKAGAESAKPPILIVTGIVGADEMIMDDISNLCGCRDIRKYIDPKLLEEDQASGLAPTVDNVSEFFGLAELVVADNNKTKFINPIHMHIYKDNGEVEDDPIYTSMIEYLERELQEAESIETTTKVGILKRRLAALKANMVEFLVGGVTIADRDAVKDLAEDAIKNCTAAAKYGVGYAANFDALRYSFLNAQETQIKYANDNSKDASIKTEIAISIFNAYYDIAEILYGTVCTDPDEIREYIINSILFGAPYNISSGELPEDKNNVSHNVKCTIMLDINILDTLSKVITIMVTCNQALLQDPSLNCY